jgi:hypothetical protein
MRKKALLDRSSPIRLNDLSDEDNGVRPWVRMKATTGKIEFDRRYTGENRYGGGFTITDPAVAREVRDQIDAWLEVVGSDAYECERCGHRVEVEPEEGLPNVCPGCGLDPRDPATGAPTRMIWEEV